MGFTKKASIEASDHILSLAWSGDILVVTPSTGPILTVSLDGTTLKEFPEHGLGNGTSAVHEDQLATCGFDGKIRFYSIFGEADSPIREITLGRGWIEHARWSPDGQYLAAALGKTLFILTTTGDTVCSFPDHKTSVSDFVWNPCNPREIATICGGGARMWRVGAVEPYAKFDWGGASLIAGWSPDGRWLATGDQTPSIHLYDFTRDYPLHIQGYETKVKAMGFAPNAKRFATGGSPLVTVWNCTGATGPEGTTPKQLKFHKGDVEAIAWSPDGDHLASGDIVGRLVISDAYGKPLSAFETEEALSSLAWNSDGKRLAAGDASGRVEIFEKAGK
ncbi:PD40 domain-containing protein [soil metagenome]